MESNHMIEKLLNDFKVYVEQKIDQGLDLKEDILLDHFFNFETERVPTEMRHYLLNWIANIKSLTFLAPVLSMTDYREIILTPTTILFESENGLAAYDSKLYSEKDFSLSFKYLILQHKEECNLTNPFTSFQIETSWGKFRISAMHKSLNPSGEEKLWFRRIQTSEINLSNFHLPPLPATIITELIVQKKNIIICGETGSGKTTFLSSLLKLISPREHLIILEDTHEISAPHHNTTQLLKSVKSHSTLADFCAYALRMRPDRIILGEMRSTEIVPFVLSMNTGHKGLMSTVHADSASDALTRMAMLFSLFSNSDLKYELILQLICKNVDAIVFMKNREVDEVIEILGSDRERPLFDVLYKSHNADRTYSIAV